MSNIQNPSNGTLLDIREIARRLGCSVRLIWAEVARKRFPAPVRVGRLARWEERDLSEYLDRARGGGAATA